MRHLPYLSPLRYGHAMLNWQFTYIHASLKFRIYELLNNSWSLLLISNSYSYWKGDQHTLSLVFCQKEHTNKLKTCINPQNKQKNQHQQGFNLTTCQLLNYCLQNPRKTNDNRNTHNIWIERSMKMPYNNPLPIIIEQ